MVHEPYGDGVDPASEDGILEIRDERLRPEHAHGEVDEIEDREQDRQAGQRLARRVGQALLPAHAGDGPPAPHLSDEIVRPGRQGGRVPGRRVEGPGRACERVLQVRQSAPFRRHRFNHGNAQHLLEGLAVDRDAQVVGLVDEIERQDHGHAHVPELSGEHQGPSQVPGIGHLHDEFCVT